MTWEELCEKAKEMGYMFVKRWSDVSEFLEHSGKELFFTHYGTVGVFFNGKGGRQIIAVNKTPEQMLAIMEVLK